MDVLIVGPRAATAGIGGVTVHVERLVGWLSRRGYPFEVCDYKSLPLRGQVAMVRKCKVVHIHASHPVLRLFYVVLGIVLGKKTILTVHGDVGRFSGLKNFIDQMAIRLCGVPVLINRKSYEKARRWNGAAVMMSAFVPPFEEEPLSESLRLGIAESRKQGKTIVATNASAMSYDRTGNEIYGIRFLVDYFKDGKIRLYVSDPSAAYRNYYGLERVGEVEFVTEKHSFYELIKAADIVVRATSTDGDSLSVKEALYAGRPVVATDCVDRPQGAILFRYNDADSLTEALADALKQVAGKVGDAENTVDAVVALYDSLLK